MPWKVFKDGDQYCVHKLKDDGSKGAKVPGGCHSSKSKAEAHKSALYANEPSAAKIDVILAGADVSLVTIPEVPIVAVGMDNPAMTGPVTFTFEDLADAVIAANNDAAIVAPRLKLGHIGGVVKSDDMPAIGTVQNMKLGDNGATIYGDYVGVPAWLAEIMPAAYPSRSIEGLMDATTTTGKTYRLVIEAVSLLGVAWPGVMTLDDLPILYGESMPEQIELSEAIKAVVNDEKGGELAASKTEQVTASVNVDDVRRAFFKQVAVDDYYWWWPCAILLDPNQIIADDEEGYLYRVPFEINGKDISFSDPVRVEIEYVDAQEHEVAARSIAAGIAASSGSRIAASYRSRHESGAPEKQKGEVVDTAAIRATLGLADDVPDEEVLRLANEKLAASAEEPETPESEEGQPHEAGSGDGEPETPAGEEPAEEEKPVEAGAVMIDAATLAQLKANAEAGAKLAKQTEEEKTEAFVDAAIKAGKFPPARRDHYLKLMKADREGTIQLVNGLADNMIPVEERGKAPSDEEATGGAAYPSEWLPEVAAARAAAESGKTPLVMTDA